MRINFDNLIHSKIARKSVNSLLILMILNVSFFGSIAEKVAAQSEVPAEVLQFAEQYKKTDETYYIYYINDKDPFSDDAEINYWYVVVYCKVDPESLNQRKITGSIVIDADNFKVLLFDELPSNNIFYAPALAFNCSFNEDKILQDDFKVYGEKKAEEFLQLHLQHIADNIRVEEAIQNNNLAEGATIICSTISTALGFYLNSIGCVPFFTGKVLDVIGALSLWNDGNQLDKLRESKVYMEQISGDFVDLVNLCGDLVNIWLVASEGSYQQVRFLIPGSGSYDDTYLQECQYIVNGFGKIAELNNDQETIEEAISAIDLLQQERLYKNTIGSRIFACYDDLGSNYRFVGPTVTDSISETVTSNSISITATYSGNDDYDGSAELYYKASSSDNWLYAGNMAKSYLTKKYTKTVSDLSPNTAYDVKVMYSDPDGVEGENPVYRFEIKTSSVTPAPLPAPPAPQLEILSDTSTDGSYIIMWSNVEEADNYNIWESEYSDFRSYSEYTENERTKHFDGKENGEYFYKVRAWNQTSQKFSEWSNVESITVSLGTLSDYAYMGEYKSGDEISSEIEIRSYSYGKYTVEIVDRQYDESLGIVKAKANVKYDGNSFTQWLERGRIYYFDNDKFQLCYVAGTIQKYTNPEGGHALVFYSEDLTMCTKTTSSNVDVDPKEVAIAPGALGTILLEFPHNCDEYYFEEEAKDWASSDGNEVEISVPLNTAEGLYHLTVLGIYDYDCSAYSIKDVNINVELPNEPPLKPLQFSGPETGYIEEVYAYSASTTDPDGDQIKYLFDWGDGEQLTSLFVNSGEIQTADHSWKEPGTYSVKVKAIDSKEASSDWSDPKTVAIYGILKDRLVFSGSTISEIMNDRCIDVDYRNFNGFYYEIDDDVGSERIRIYNTLVTDPRTIEGEGLAYITDTFLDYYEYPFNDVFGEQYEKIALFGDEYIPINPECSKLARLLIDNDEEYILEEGVPLELAAGYELTAKEIDIEGNDVFLEFSKDGELIASELMSLSYINPQDNTWDLVLDNIEGENGVTVFRVHGNQVFSGINKGMVEIEGAWLIDFKDILTINPGTKFGILEVDDVNEDGIRMINSDPIILELGSEYAFDKGIKLEVADDSELRFRFVKEHLNDDPYEVRGSVAYGSSEWNFTNFPGLYYKLDENVSTENLIVNVFSEGENYIYEDGLVYTTTVEKSPFECASWSDENYNVVALFAEPYVSINNTLPNKLARLLCDSGETSILREGVPLYLGGGYELTPTQVDVVKNRVFLELTQNGKFVVQGVVDLSSGINEWTYRTDVSDESNVEVLRVNVAEISEDLNGDCVVINGLWFIEFDEIVDINPDTEFGALEVSCVSPDSITLTNDDEIYLMYDAIIDIGGNLKLLVADDVNSLRYYPFVDKTVDTQLIKSYSPKSSSLSSNVDEPVYFNVILDERSDVTWQLDGEIVYEEYSVLSSSYECALYSEGSHSLKVYVENADRSAENEWLWTILDWSSPENAQKIRGPIYGGNSLIEIFANCATYDEYGHKCLEINSRDFAGFYYDLDDDISTEKILIYESEDYGGPQIGERTIPEDCFEYRTEIRQVDFKFDVWDDQQYNVLSLFGKEYVALERYSPGKLANLLLDSDEKITLTVGQPYDLGSGFKLEVKDIDSNYKNVWLELSRYGTVLDSEIIDSWYNVWIYDRDNVAGEDDVPVFGVCVDQINGDENTVVVEGLWLIDYTQVLVIEPDEMFGPLEVYRARGEALVMRNDDPIYLSPGSVFELGGGIKLEVANDTDVRFQLTKEPSTDNPCEIHGSPASGIFEWDCSSFAGLYYDLDRDIGTEKLSVSSLSDRKIAEGELTYTTNVQEVDFKSLVWAGDIYPVIALLGDLYVPLSETVPDKIARLLMDNNDENVLRVGSPLDLGNGYSLNVSEILLDERKVSLELSGPNSFTTSYVVDLSSGYYDWIHEEDILDESDVKVFRVHINEISQDQAGGFAVVEGIWLVDFVNTLEINEGDRFGNLEVNSIVFNEICLENYEDLYLLMDSIIDLGGSFKLRVADSEVLRYYPIVGSIESEDNKEKLPVPAFSSNVTFGFAPLVVDFVDQSINASSLEWDFGDGTYMSNVRDPVHVYDTPGIYDVSLIGSNDYGYATKTSENYIIVGSTDSINFILTCPVDMEIEDPDGLVVNKQVIQIPGASYTETDINNDGDPDDVVSIPNKKQGNYKVKVIPENDAKPSDTYTLEVSTTENSQILAEDVLIYELPETGYVLDVDYQETTSPASITNLSSSTGNAWINWTWSNPSDPDFSHIEIYLNDIFQTSTSAEYFNATGLEPETDYTIGTRTVDIYGNVNETWVNLTATTAASEIKTYDISLSEGWNLISIPLAPEETSIGSVLSQVIGSYSIVWAYDVSDSADPWKKYDPSVPFGNDLSEIKPGKGYWIMMTAGETLSITGPLPEKSIPDMASGWNLIGYDSLTGQPIEDALSSVIGDYSIVWAFDVSDSADPWKKYDPSVPFGNDLTDMGPGRGYWILEEGTGY